MRTGALRWCLGALALAGPLAAQELEPRALQNAPVGANLVLGAAGYSRGNLLMDAALPIEGARADVWSVTGGLVRAISLFGKSGKIGVVAPWAVGTWSGTLNGVDTATARTGFGDPRIQLSMNFIGAPALTRSQMARYRPKTVVGLQLLVTVPLGQYYPERLINLGSHRWSFQSRLGVSQTLNRHLAIEGYAGGTFYTTNGDYFGGMVLSQAPFLEGQVHAIYMPKNPNLWMAASIGYGWGGQATVNGVEKEALQNVRASAVLRVPLARQHALKFIYVNGLTTRLGTDFDTFQVSYQYAFGGRP